MNLKYHGRVPSISEMNPSAHVVWTSHLRPLSNDFHAAAGVDRGSVHPDPMVIGKQLPQTVHRNVKGPLSFGFSSERQLPLREPEVRNFGAILHGRLPSDKKRHQQGQAAFFPCAT